MLPLVPPPPPVPNYCKRGRRPRAGWCRRSTRTRRGAARALTALAMPAEDGGGRRPCRLPRLLLRDRRRLHDAVKAVKSGKSGGKGKKKAVVPPPPPGPPPGPPPAREAAAVNKSAKGKGTASAPASVTVGSTNKNDDKVGGGSRGGGGGGLGGILFRRTKAQQQKQQPPPPPPPPSTAVGSTSSMAGTPRNDASANANAVGEEFTPGSARTVQTAPSTGRFASSQSQSGRSTSAGRSAYRNRRGAGGGRALGGFLSPDGSTAGAAALPTIADHGNAGFVSPPAAATAGVGTCTKEGSANAAVATARMAVPPPPPPPPPQAGTGATAATAKANSSSSSSRRLQRIASAASSSAASVASPIRATRLGFASPRPAGTPAPTPATRAPASATTSAEGAPPSSSSAVTPPVVRKYRNEKERMEERHRAIRRNRSVVPETAPAAPPVAAGTAGIAAPDSARSSGRRSWGQSVRDYHNSGSSAAKARSSAARKVRKDASSLAAAGVAGAAAAATPTTIAEEADNSPNDAVVEHEDKVSGAEDGADSSMMRSIMSVNDEGEVEVSVSQFSRVSASSSTSASTSSRWGRSVRGGGAGSSSRWGGGGDADSQKTRRERREPVPTGSSTIPPPPPPPPVPAHLLSADQHVGRIVLLQSVARRWLVQRRLEREAAVAAMCNETVDTTDLLNTTPVPVFAEKEGTAIPTSLLGKFGFNDSNEVEDSLLLMGGVDSSVDHSGDVDGGLTARRLEREQREAATVIQTAQRSSLERRKYAQLRTKREGAAATIQSSVRAASVRRDFCKNVQAAVLIQSLARGAVKRREIEQQHQAATTIQAHVRGMAGREDIIRYCTHIEQSAAATKIQNSYRGSKQRQKFAKQAGAIVGIQALARGCLDRKSLANRTENNISTKEDRAARIAKAEAEAKRLKSTSPVDDGDVDRAMPVLSSTSVDSNSGSDDKEGLVGSDASCSDAPSVDIESEIAQAFDIGQEALRSAPEKDEVVPTPTASVANNDQDTKDAKEEIDEANILKAKHFLTHPSTVSLPMEEKRKYLLSKGLNESEIKASVDAVAQEWILEQGLLHDDTGTKVTLETSLIVKNDELKKQKDSSDTGSNASTNTADKSSLDLPRGDSADDTFDSETKANKSGLNTSVLSQTLNKSIERMKQVDVKLPSCCCLPSHLPNRVVIGLLLFVILLAVGLYLIYTFAVGSLI